MNCEHCYEFGTQCCRADICKCDCHGAPQYEFDIEDSGDGSGEFGMHFAWTFDSKEQAEETAKRINKALVVLHRAVREKTAEKVKQVGSCDQHDRDLCSDCEKFFMLQRLLDA